MTYTPNNEYFSFVLKKKQYIEEIHSHVYLFEHKNLGCPVLAIKNDDENKTFSAAFNTIPTDSTGVAHILEHSVLMGSEKYPVKDVFGEINKGGLMTFLNAMTGSDITYYPFATRNIKEYFNIMDVYCDVVFRPLLDKSTFEQEGWHYHQESADSPLEYQGVVYNEMKGAFSDPIRHIFHNMYTGLMPNSTYAHESGGDPKNITDLSYQEFCDFHKKHYHASNGMYFFYGNAPLEDELSYLEEKFATHFPEKGIRAEVVQGDIIEEPVFIDETYASDSKDVAEKTFIAVGTAIGRVEDREKNTAFQIIANILFNSDGSPLKKAIVSSGLCKDFGGLFMASSSYRTFMISYLVGSEKENRDKFLQVYHKALNEMVEQGLEKDLILSELNKYEFSAREDSSKAQRGLDLIGKAMPALKYGLDPFESLVSEELLQNIRHKALEEDYFEHLIKELLLDNKRTVTLTLAPDPEKQEANAQEERKRLEEYDAQLTDEQRAARIARTQEIMAQQLEVNTVDHLALLPQLGLDDLSAEIQYHQATEEDVDGQKIIINDLDTNHISYIDIGFDFSGVAEKHLPYLDLFGSIITEIGTKDLDYMAFAKEIATNTGGFSFSLTTYTHCEKKESLLPMAWFHLKTLPHYLEKTMKLLTSLLSAPSFADKTRIREIVGREFTWTEHAAQSEGYSLASTRVASHLSLGGRYQEITGGITAFRKLRELALNYDAKEEEFLTCLSEIAQAIFNKKNVHLAITANREEIESFKALCPDFISQLGEKEIIKTDVAPLTIADHEGFITSAEVVYAVQGGNLFPNGEGYNGHFEVLKTYLSRDYLWNTVRQMGGAYGCFIQFSQLKGNIAFVSYRDPQVAKTYDAYAKLNEVTANLELPKEMMAQLIIGTYGNFTPHQSQATRGAIARNEYFTGITPEYKQQRISEITNTQVEDLTVFAPYFTTMLEKSYRSTIGNRTRIEKDSSLFDIVEEL